MAEEEDLEEEEDVEDLAVGRRAAEEEADHPVAGK